MFSFACLIVLLNHSLPIFSEAYLGHCLRGCWKSIFKKFQFFKNFPDFSPIFTQYFPDFWPQNIKKVAPAFSTKVLFSRRKKYHNRIFQKNFALKPMRFSRRQYPPGTDTLYNYLVGCSHILTINLT